MDRETHEAHHKWIEDEIEEKRQCRENRQKILNHVLGWGVIALITGIGTLALKVLKAAGIISAAVL